jgi:Tripartite tricarboxylate transporter TctB family
MAADTPETGADDMRRGLLKSPQDFAAGLFLLVFAIILYSQAYQLKFGQLRGIGPGLMPQVTALLLALAGVALVVQSFVSHGSKLDRWSLRGPLFVLGAVCLFAATIRGASFTSMTLPYLGTIPLNITIPSLGLVVSGPLAVIVSGFADKDTRWFELLVYAVVITTLCIGLFKFALRLPIPLAPWLLGY